MRLGKNLYSAGDSSGNQNEGTVIQGVLNAALRCRVRRKQEETELPDQEAAETFDTHSDSEYSKPSPEHLQSKPVEQEQEELEEELDEEELYKDEPEKDATARSSEAKRQRRLKASGPCPQGFEWTRRKGCFTSSCMTCSKNAKDGYQCSGGAHWICMRCTKKL